MAFRIVEVPEMKFRAGELYFENPGSFIEAGGDVHDRGRRLNGERIDTQPTKKIIAKGVAIVPENRRIFPLFSTPYPAVYIIIPVVP